MYRYLRIRIKSITRGSGFRSIDVYDTHAKEMRFFNLFYTDNLQRTVLLSCMGHGCPILYDDFFIVNLEPNKNAPFLKL
jgi:hypothetical protein